MPLTKAFAQDPRVHKEATALVGAGHEVTVLEWARHVPDQPARETIDGVDVVRETNTPLMDRLPGALFKNPLWWRLGRRRALELDDEDAFDVVHCHDLDTLPIGARLKDRRGTRLVFDAHEIFARMIAEDHPAPVAWAAQRLEDRLLPDVDLLVTVNDPCAGFYRSRVDAPVVLVMNAPEIPDEVPPWPEGPFTVVYIGLFKAERFFPDAVHVVGGMEDVRFLVAGKREGIYDEVRDAAARYDNVEFLGPLRYDEVVPTTGQGHVVHAMSDPRAPHNEIATETKMLDAMAVGRPSILSRGTYSGTFAEEHGIGTAVEFGADGLREAVARLRDDPDRAREMGGRGRALAEEEVNWPRQADRLLEAYEDLETGR